MNARFLSTLGAALAVASCAWSQGINNSSRINSAPRQDGINASTDVRVEQKLDAQLPLERTFRDEAGRSVTLGQYFGKRPVLILMPFYKCTATCVAIQNGVADLIREPGLRFKVGQDYDVITISINPRETADVAAAKKRALMSEVGLPGADRGWHFLTGEEPDIRAVADASGYHYKYDVRTDQYAHASAVWLATPKGKISRYFFGVVYPAKDVRLALTEAGQGHIGTLADQWLLYCYHYDPQKGKYGVAVFRLLQVFGLATVLLLGTFIFTNLRREVRDSKKSELTPETDSQSK